MSETNYWNEVNRRNAEEIGAIKIGDWVNLRDEYGDVWHEVVQIWTGKLLHRAISIINRGRQEYTFVYKVRKVASELPADARIVDRRVGGLDGRLKAM